MPHHIYEKQVVLIFCSSIKSHMSWEIFLVNIMKKDLHTNMNRDKGVIFCIQFLNCKTIINKLFILKGCRITSRFNLGERFERVPESLWGCWRQDEKAFTKDSPLYIYAVFLAKACNKLLRVWNVPGFSGNILANAGCLSNWRNCFCLFLSVNYDLFLDHEPSSEEDDAA